MMGFHHLGCVFVHVRGADWRLIHVQDGTYHRVTLLQHGDEYRAAGDAKHNGVTPLKCDLHQIA